MKICGGRKIEQEVLDEVQSKEVSAKLMCSSRVKITFVKSPTSPKNGPAILKSWPLCMGMDFGAQHLGPLVNVSDTRKARFHGSHRWFFINFLKTMCIPYLEKKKVIEAHYQRYEDDYQKKMFTSYFCRARLGLRRVKEVIVAFCYCLFSIIFSIMCFYYFDDFLYY